MRNHYNFDNCMGALGDKSQWHLNETKVAIGEHLNPERKKKKMSFNIFRNILFGLAVLAAIVIFACFIQGCGVECDHFDELIDGVTGCDGGECETAVLCGDGIDNDSDGLTDCADPSCQTLDDVLTCVPFTVCVDDCYDESIDCMDETGDLVLCTRQHRECRKQCLSDGSVYGGDQCNIDLYEDFYDCLSDGFRPNFCLEILCFNLDCPGLADDPVLSNAIADCK